MQLTVTHNPAAHRYELYRDDELLSFAVYHEDEGVTVVRHVETLLPHRGNDYAAELMAGLLEHLRADGRTVLPVCWYAADYLRNHPDQHDLLA